MMTSPQEKEGDKLVNDEEEYEEQLFLLELTGIFDRDAVESAVTENNCRVVRLDTDQPIVQVGDGLYMSKWDESLHTDVLFEINNDEKTLKFTGIGDRRLVAEKAVIVNENDNNDTSK